MEEIQELTSGGNMFDDEYYFAKPALINGMAEGMMLPPPEFEAPEFEYKHEDVCLWSYGYDTGGLSSRTYKKQSSILDCKITVEDKQAEQQPKLLFIMGIPICKEQVAQPQNETDSVYHFPDPELTLVDALKHKEHVASGENKGEQLGQLLSVKVINSSTHNEPESFKIGQPESSLPHHEGSENEGNASQQLPRLQLLLKDGNEQDEHVLDIEQSNSNIKSDEETVSGGTSRTDNVAEIIHLELEEELHIKCIEPQYLTSQPKSSEEILEDEGNTVEIVHSALEMTLDEAVKHKQHALAAERVDELVEESPVEDVRYSTSDEDIECVMAVAFRPFIAMKSLSQQQVKDKTMVLDTSAHKLMLSEDVIQIQNKGIIMGKEKDDKTIHFTSETFIEDTSEREKQSEKDISFGSLREHFGRPLDDAAKSFGVSRSTFKRICRGLGIKRWQYGKRRMSNRSSSNLGRVNDKKTSIKNFSYSGMPPLRDRSVAHPSQDRIKINVKATYNGVAIRFELFDSSGMAELEDNVIQRLKRERDTFSIKYQDDEGDWVLIACDKDVQKCIEISRSLGK